MKKRIVLLSLLCLGLFHTGIFAEISNSSQNIKRFKIQHPYSVPCAPSLYPVSFKGALLMEQLAITAFNYTGSITVHITGLAGALTQTAQITADGSVTLNIASLPEGEYDIEIMTEGKGTFAGNFEV